jgi:predicted ferric reductase
MDWDVPTILVAAWNFGLLIVGAVLARLSLAATSKFFQDGATLWSAANIAGVALAVAALVVYTVRLGVDDEGNRTVFLTGLAAGLALPGPMFFAMFRAGAEDVLKMSRERAWRVHTFLGDVALIFATVHGIVAFLDVPEPLSNILWLFGLIALVLMWLGVVPVFFQSLHLDKLFSYDKFKIMHYFTAIGFIFAVIHMLDHAMTLGTARSWLVTILNIAALALFVAQRVWVSATSSVESVTANAIGRSGGEQYVTLSLKASRFAKAYKPGQWGHLTYDSVIKHPFTCTVTDEDPDTVKIVIKVSGSWTSKLAQACAQGTPKLKLEGPYGIPPLQPNIPAQYDAVVFVLGGVGVTPALALVPLAKESGFKQVHFFWSMRSSALLEHCAPFLDSRLTPEHSCIRLTSSGQAGQLPLGAKTGRHNIGEWLTETAKTISGASARSALVFICGPHALAAAAHKALGRSNSQVIWHIHAEQFAFLPQFVPPRTSGGPSAGTAVSEEPNLLGKANEY